MLSLKKAKLKKQGVVEIIYHDYNPPKGYKKNKNNPWGKGKVTKIIKTGKKYKF